MVIHTVLLTGASYSLYTEKDTTLIEAAIASIMVFMWFSVFFLLFNNFKRNLALLIVLHSQYRLTQTLNQILSISLGICMVKLGWVNTGVLHLVISTGFYISLSALGVKK